MCKHSYASYHSMLLTSTCTDRCAEPAPVSLYMWVGRSVCVCVVLAVCVCVWHHMKHGGLVVREMPVFSSFLPGSWSVGRESNRRQNDWVKGCRLEHSVSGYSGIKLQLWYKTRLPLVGGGDRTREKGDATREIKEAWGIETEMSDVDLKMRQQEMKGGRDRHRGAERRGYRGF